MSLQLVLFVLGLALAARAAPRAQSADELWDAGRRAEAVDQMADELAARPDDDALRRRYVERAFAIHRYRAALDAMGPAPPAEPGATEPVFGPFRGRALYHLSRYDEAVLHLQPHDGLQALMIVDALEALGRRNEAERALDEAERVLGAEHARILCLRARSAQRRGDHAAAVVLFRASLVQDPWDAEALFGLGQSLVRTGERAEGLALLERHRELVKLLDELDYARRGVDLAPRHASNWARLGDLERAIGREQRAADAYRTALALATDDELVPIVLRAARLEAEDRGRRDAAIAMLASAATRVSDPRLHVRAGDYARAAGRPAEALAHYERARALRPDDRAIAERIAEVRAELDG